MGEQFTTDPCYRAHDCGGVMIEAAELVRLRTAVTEHKRQIKFHRRRLRWTHERITELEVRLKQAGIRAHHH